MKTQFSAIVLSLACVVLSLATGFQPAAAADTQPDAAVAGVSTLHSYSAARLYNAGNAAARAGKRGLAVLNYERARLLAPGDSDIRANLQTVLEQAGLPALHAGWFAERARFASPDTLYWWGLAGLLFVGGGMISRRLRPTPLIANIVTVVGVGTLVLTAGGVLATRPLLHASVVMNPAGARASPVGSGDPLFTLPAGELVHVRDEHLGYLLVRDGLGHEGWVARDNFAPVVPPDPGNPLKPS